MPVALHYDILFELNQTRRRTMICVDYSVPLVFRIDHSIVVRPTTVGLVLRFLSVSKARSVSQKEHHTLSSHRFASLFCFLM